VREALQAWGGVYVIENVAGAARIMENPVKVCGSAFGLPVRRHRFFESNAFLVPTECSHHAQGRPIGVYGDHGEPSGEFLRPNGTRRGRKAASIAEAQTALGIDWMSDWDDLTDAIPPAYTEFLGAQLLAHLESEAA
jgi:DNA (cytosine-5)-methyltransferase 1